MAGYFIVTFLLDYMFVTVFTILVCDLHQKNVEFVNLTLDGIEIIEINV